MTLVVPIPIDHPALTRVAELFDDYRVHHGQPASPEATAAWLREQLTRHRLTVAAAVRADEMCGFVTVMVMPAALTLGDAWSIRDLYVTPAHRRNGVATTLLQHVIAGARVADARRVSLQTETGNRPALALYHDAGFRPVTGLELLNLPLDPAAG